MASCNNYWLKDQLNEHDEPVVFFCISEAGHFSPHTDGKEYWITIQRVVREADND